MSKFLAISPCLCGNKAIIKDAFDCADEKVVFYVQCLSCRKFNDYEYNRREAIESWNNLQEVAQ